MSNWIHLAAGAISEDEYREVESLYTQAKTEIPLMQKISISTVQRHYKIGYNRAARLLERLCPAAAARSDHG